MHKLELKLERKLVWLVCNLHTNELPLRNLLINLDGPTLSNNQFSGSIGKALSNATEYDINPNFTPISIGPPLIELPEEVIGDLSTDQHYGYKIVCAIREGKLPKELSLLEIGPVNHSRWLTTANRVLRLWVSKNRFDRNHQKNLQYLAEFVIGVYYPCWFQAKVKHSWIEGPRHLLYQLECLRSQNKKIVDIVMPTVKRSAWYGHSESIIQSLLCSEVRQERKEGAEKILNIREGAEFGDMSVRVRKTPDINVDATSLIGLIDWSDGHDPLLTCSLSTSEIKDFIDTLMAVPAWPCHAQGWKES